MFRIYNGEVYILIYILHSFLYIGKETEEGRTGRNYREIGVRVIIIAIRHHYRAHSHSPYRSLTFTYLRIHSHSQAQLPTTINLKSSATLGTGKSSTTKQRLDKLEDKEVRRALDGRTGNGKRRRQNDIYEVVGAMGSGSDEDEDGDDEGGKTMDMHVDGDGDGDEKRTQTAQKQVIVVDSTSQPVASTSTVGSALQRNPDGSIVAPKIKRLKGRKVRLTFTVENLKYFY